MGFNVKNLELRSSKPLLIVLLVMLLALMSSTNAASFTQSLCGGSGSSGGIIPTTNILSGQSSGEQSVINISVLIMLTMLLVIALIYMVSHIVGVDSIKNMAKQEFAELIVTAVIVSIFIGGFNLAAAGISSTNVFHAAGSNFGRQIYVDDCISLSNTSFGLIIPLSAMSVVRYGLDTVESLNLTFEPNGFGFQISPLRGYDLFDKVIGLLIDITAAFILFIVVTLFTVGFVYGLFPIFLYAGIVLRTIPWTRAAGGAFLGLFVGFYIVFPLLLHLMLSGYIPAVSNAAINADPTVTQAYIAGVAAGAAGGGSALLGSAMSFLTQLGVLFVGVPGGNSYGLINGYIFFVIEPAAFTMFAIVLAFIIAFDFAEITGGLLGSPSLRAEAIIGSIRSI
jgi:hypothetical protein